MRNLKELPKLRDSLSYLYVEHAIINQKHKAIEAIDKTGATMIPAANLSVLMLGPGTSISHAAISALAANGCSIVWSGTDGNKFYAQGMGETRKAYNLLKQAELVSDPAKRKEVVIRMYRFRFNQDLPTDLSLPQIRGHEGVRVRKAYAYASDKYGVKWNGRNYDRQNWNRSDPINRAISAANAVLNGVCHAAIVSGGYSPALGYIHNGKQLSFVYDVADLYKVDLTIPLAFEVVAESTAEIERRVRRAARERFRETKLLKRILPDIETVLGLRATEDKQDPLDEDPALPTQLWEELFPNVSEAEDGHNDS